MNAHEVLFCTTLITAKNDKVQSKGSGFFAKYKNGYYLITNNHIIIDKTNFSIKIKTSADNETVNFTNQNVVISFHSKYDLCVIAIDRIVEYNQLQSKSILNTFINLNDDNYPQFEDIESVVVCGYPCGFRDEVNNLPLVNSGITATSLNYNYNGREIFITNTHTYSGSSGSPVFINQDDNYYFVGVQYANMPLPSTDDLLTTIEEDKQRLFKYISSSIFSENIKYTVLLDMLANTIN